MQKQFKENDVKDFLNWHGQPLWSKIIKFKKDKNGLTTYAIPTQKNGTITGFFAITFDKGNIKFEMHRENAIKLKKAEYTFSDINLTKSKKILEIFSNNPKNKNTEETNSLTNCFWIWVLNETFQKEPTNNMEGCDEYCGHWEWHCEVTGGGPGNGSGDPGGGSGGGGTGGGCGGGGNTETFTSNWWNEEPSNLTPCELNEMIYRIAGLLGGISNLQSNFLRTYPNMAEEIDRFLFYNPQSTQIAKDHLDKITQDFDYFNFVLNHSQTGDHLKMWWEDEVWLESMHYDMEESFLNFYLDATQKKNPKPIEFSDICTGMPSIIQASQGDKKERVGYVTLDGKFLYSSSLGTSGEVQPGVRSKNGQFYYNYKMNLGAPTQNYAGMIIDNDRQEYWIPIRTIIHTHVPYFGNNGAAITTTNPEKSEDDHKMADILQKNNYFNAVNLYVVEVKDNGKFLVASFSKDSTDYDILGDDLILPNPNVCSLIY